MEEENDTNKQEIEESEIIKEYLKKKMFRDSDIYDYMNGQQSRTLYKKIAFIENLQKVNGIISLACKLSGIKSRKTVYNWMKKDPNLRKIVNELNKIRDDMVFDVLLERIFYKKDGSCIRYYLSKCHPEFMRKRTTIPPKKGPQTLDELFKIIEAKEKVQSDTGV